jgi:nicotinate-nucleotide adenylyltransferase
MKVGLFFGSFNPIHIGHLIIANMVLEQTDIKEVWFVVSPQNPFKSSKFLAHEFDRLKMVELAIQDHWGFRASDVEFHMPRPSYTAHTLAWLSDKHPHHEFKVIMGEDNLQNFPKWKNYKAILDNYGIIVYPRPGASISQEPITHPNILIIQAPLLDISATFLRQCFRKNISTKFLLPDSVSDYIKAKAIYP